MTCVGRLELFLSMPQVGSSHLVSAMPQSSEAHKAVAALQPAVGRLVCTGPQQRPNADEITQMLRAFDQRSLHYVFELAYVPLVAMLRQSYKSLPEDSTISLIEALSYLLDRTDPAGEPPLPQRRLQSLYPTVTTAVLFPISDYHSTDRSMPEELVRALIQLASALLKYRRLSPVSSRNPYHMGYTIHLLLNPLRLEGDRKGQVLCFDAIRRIGVELAREGEDLGQWYPGVVSTISSNVVMDPHASRAVLSAALDCWRKWLLACVSPDVPEDGPPPPSVTGTGVALGKVIGRFGTSTPLPAVPTSRLLLEALERMPRSWGQIPDALDIIVTAAAVEQEGSLTKEVMASHRYREEIARYATERACHSIDRGDWKVLEGYVMVAQSSLDVREVWQRCITVVKPQAADIKDVLSERQPLHPGESGSPLAVQQSVESLWAEVDRITDQSLGSVWLGSVLPVLRRVCGCIVEVGDLTTSSVIADASRVPTSGFYLWLSFVPEDYWQCVEVIELMVGRVEEDTSGWDVEILDDRVEMYMMLRAISKACTSIDALTPILTRLLCSPLLACLGCEFPYLRSAASLAMASLASKSGVSSVGELIYDNADRIVDRVVFMLRHSPNPSSAAPLILALSRYSSDSTGEMSFWLADIVKELIRVTTKDEAWILQCLSAVLWVVFKAQYPDIRSGSGVASPLSEEVPERPPPLEVLLGSLSGDPDVGVDVWQARSSGDAIGATALSDEDLRRALTPTEWMGKVSLERVTPVLTATESALLTPALWCVSRALPLIPEPARPAALADCWPNLKAAAMQPRSKPHCLLACLNLLSNVLLTSTELTIFMSQRIWSDLWPAMRRVDQHACHPEHSMPARLQLAICNSVLDLCAAMAASPEMSPNSDATAKELLDYLFDSLPNIEGERAGLVGLALTKLAVQQFDLVMSDGRLPSDIREEIMRQVRRNKKPRIPLRIPAGDLKKLFTVGG